MLAIIALAPNDNSVDGTVGAGGHAAAILGATSPHGRLLGCDLDDAALSLAKDTLSAFGERAMLVRGNYRDIARIVAETQFGPVHTALLDLGYSSIEIDDPTRGFSFRFDGPLDMRFDVRQELTAAEIVNTWPEDDLAQIIWEYGEDRHARRIAKALVSNRRQERIVSTQRLADIVTAATPGGHRRGQINPATRTFQALRIATNDELGNVREGVAAMFNVLEHGGRLAVISFHSLEDRIVKELFRALEDEEKATLLTKKPIIATEQESSNNPRARSAKLRGIKKT